MRGFWGPTESEYETRASGTRVRKHSKESVRRRRSRRKKWLKRGLGTAAALTGAYFLHKNKEAITQKANDVYSGIAQKAKDKYTGVREQYLNYTHPVQGPQLPPEGYIDADMGPQLPPEGYIDQDYGPQLPWHKRVENKINLDFMPYVNDALDKTVPYQKMAADAIDRGIDWTKSTAVPAAGRAYDWTKSTAVPAAGRAYDWTKSTAAPAAGRALVNTAKFGYNTAKFGVNTVAGIPGVASTAKAFGRRVGSVTRRAANYVLPREQDIDVTPYAPPTADPYDDDI